MAEIDKNGMGSSFIHLLLAERNFNVYCSFRACERNDSNFAGGCGLELSIYKR